MASMYAARTKHTRNRSTKYSHFFHICITSLRQGSANRLFRLEQRPAFILSRAPAFVNLRRIGPTAVGPRPAMNPAGRPPLRYFPAKPENNSGTRTVAAAMRLTGAPVPPCAPSGLPAGFLEPQPACRCVRIWVPPGGVATKTLPSGFRPRLHTSPEAWGLFPCLPASLCLPLWPSGPPVAASYVSDSIVPGLHRLSAC